MTYHQRSSSSRILLAQNTAEQEEYRKRALAIQRELRAVAVSLGTNRRRFIRKQADCLRLSRSSSFTSSGNQQGQAPAGDLGLVESIDQPRPLRPTMSRGEQRQSEDRGVEVAAIHGKTLPVVKELTGNEASSPTPDTQPGPDPITAREPTKPNFASHRGGNTISSIQKSRASSLHRLRRLRQGTSNDNSAKDLQDDPSEESEDPVYLSHRMRSMTVGATEQLNMSRLRQIYDVHIGTQRPAVHGCEENTQQRIRDFLERASSGTGVSDSTDLASESGSSTVAWPTAGDRRRRVSRIYGLEQRSSSRQLRSNSTSTVFNGGGIHEDNTSKDKLRLPPLSLPPVHSNVPLKLLPRNYSKRHETPRTLTREEWDDLKHCRYLRTKFSL